MPENIPVSLFPPLDTKLSPTEVDQRNTAWVLFFGFFFPFCALHTHICAFSEVYLPIVILFIYLLYLLACQHCIIKKPCDSY